MHNLVFMRSVVITWTMSVPPLTLLIGPSSSGWVMAKFRYSLQCKVVSPSLLGTAVASIVLRLFFPKYTRMTARYGRWNSFFTTTYFPGGGGGDGGDGGGGGGGGGGHTESGRTGKNQPRVSCIKRAVLKIGVCGCTMEAKFPRCREQRHNRQQRQC